MDLPWGTLYHAHVLTRSADALTNLSRAGRVHALSGTELQTPCASARAPGVNRVTRRTPGIRNTKTFTPQTNGRWRGSTDYCSTYLIVVPPIDRGVRVSNSSVYSTIEYRRIYICNNIKIYLFDDVLGVFVSTVISA